jgi:hypothetical protein
MVAAGRAGGELTGPPATVSRPRPAPGSGARIHRRPQLVIAARPGAPADAGREEPQRQRVGTCCSATPHRQSYILSRRRIRRSPSLREGGPRCPSSPSTDPRMIAEDFRAFSRSYKSDLTNLEAVLRQCSRR